MYELEHQEHDLYEIIPHQIYERRSGAERRKEPRCGFACISIVGWICRREKFRREDDRDAFFNHKD